MGESGLVHGDNGDQGDPGDDFQPLIERLTAPPPHQATGSGGQGAHQRLSQVQSQRKETPDVLGDLLRALPETERPRRLRNQSLKAARPEPNAVRDGWASAWRSLSPSDVASDLLRLIAWQPPDKAAALLADLVHPLIVQNHEMQASLIEIGSDLDVLADALSDEQEPPESLPHRRGGRSGFLNPGRVGPEPFAIGAQPAEMRVSQVMVLVEAERVQQGIPAEMRVSQQGALLRLRPEPEPPAGRVQVVSLQDDVLLAEIDRRLRSNSLSSETKRSMARLLQAYTGRGKPGPKEPPMETKIALVEEWERLKAKKGVSQTAYVDHHAAKIYAVSLRTFQEYCKEVRLWRKVNSDFQ